MTMRKYMIKYLKVRFLPVFRNSEQHNILQTIIQQQHLPGVDPAFVIRRRPNSEMGYSRKQTNRGVEDVELGDQDKIM